MNDMILDKPVLLPKEDLIKVVAQAVLRLIEGGTQDYDGGTVTCGIIFPSWDNV